MAGFGAFSWVQHTSVQNTTTRERQLLKGCAPKSQSLFHSLRTCNVTPCERIGNSTTEAHGGKALLAAALAPLPSSNAAFKRSKLRLQLLRDCLSHVRHHRLDLHPSSYKQTAVQTGQTKPWFPYPCLHPRPRHWRQQQHQFSSRTPKSSSQQQSIGLEQTASLITINPTARAHSSTANEFLASDHQHPRQPPPQPYALRKPPSTTNPQSTLA